MMTLSALILSLPTRNWTIRMRPYDVAVQVAPWRGNPRFVDVLMVTALATPNVLGDYHLIGTSPAIGAGTATGAPGYDFDDQTRPQGPAVDIGADEVPQ